MSKPFVRRIPDPRGYVAVVGETIEAGRAVLMISVAAELDGRGSGFPVPRFDRAGAIKLRAAIDAWLARRPVLETKAKKRPAARAARGK